MDGVVVYFVLLLSVMMVELSTVAIHHVGESTRWIVGFDYTKWDSSKKFSVGDTLVFEYPKWIHNVAEVGVDDYQSCDVETPIKVYTSGNDSVTLKSTGNHFFICGAPDHCPAGQKLGVEVAIAGSNTRASVDAPATQSTAPHPLATSTTPATATSTTKANGSSSKQTSVAIALAVLASTVVCGQMMY